MSGHSKWSTIQHKKGALDKKRANLFTKLAREITVAAKLGDSNPDMNPRLRLAISAARKMSMPSDNIKRAVAKADAGNGEGNYEEIRYEGYGPSSVAVIIETLTDNRNRTAPEIRSVFGKNGGNMGESGSVAFSFKRIGLILYKKDIADDDKVFEVALESGAENVESEDEGHFITCAPDDLHAVSTALEKVFGEPEKAELSWEPMNTVSLSGDAQEKFEKFIDLLEDLDDVQRVYTNAEFA
ncbi:MAG: YebC/PmpR family DNA-binding transcriptional regulator [Alphaproteobacteria bacterium]|nr:YebC/PmpR family DNA-binding transcriptional regulator [Alphaproteobacteria bacterium]